MVDKQIYDIEILFDSGDRMVLSDESFIKLSLSYDTTISNTIMHSNKVSKTGHKLISLSIELWGEQEYADEIYDALSNHDFIGVVINKTNYFKDSANKKQLGTYITDREHPADNNMLAIAISYKGA